MILITKDFEGTFHIHEIEISEDFSSIRVPCILKTHKPVSGWVMKSIQSEDALSVKFDEQVLVVGCGVNLNHEKFREFCKTAA